MGRVKAMLMEKLEKAEALASLWDDLEEAGTAEQAAYSIACEQLGIDEIEGYELLALAASHQRAQEEGP